MLMSKQDIANKPLFSAHFLLPKRARGGCFLPSPVRFLPTPSSQSLWEPALYCVG